MKSKQLILIAVSIFLFQPCFGQRRSAEREARPQRFTETFVGRTITEGYHIDGKRMGRWNFYDVFEVINFSGSYYNGLKTGKWIYRHEEKIMSILFFTNGVIDSINAFYPDGQISYKLRYTDGDSGFAKFFYPNGNLEAFIPIINGRIDGVFSHYFENGQLHRQTKFKAGERYSALKTFDLQGSEISGGTLQNGTGTYVIYFLPEKTSEETTLRIRRMYNYRDGKMIASRYLFPNGIVQRTSSFDNDTELFTIRHYDENRTLLHTFETKNLPTHRIEEENRRRKLFTGDLIFAGDNPSFQGDTNILRRFLAENIRFPVVAQQNRIQGRVTIGFVVSETGEIDDIEVVRSVSPELDAEAIRVIKAMPRWNPGFQAGVPVRHRFTLPITFRLQ